MELSSTELHLARIFRLITIVIKYFGIFNIFLFIFKILPYICLSKICGYFCPNSFNTNLYNNEAKIELFIMLYFVRHFFNASHNAVKCIFVYIFLILSANTNRNISFQAGGLGYMCIAPKSHNFVFSCQNTI